MYIKFLQNWVSKSVKTMRTNIFAKNGKLRKFATIPIVSFKSITSDMHHHKTYMYFIFQQNWVCRSVKTMHTHLLQKLLVA